MYGYHHKETDSPLLKIANLDMIEQFPVSDSLHLLHLGVMKRLMTGWRDGTFRNTDTKWPSATTEAVSEYLNQCKMPVEFHRTVRGLDCLSMWKGTEFRTFLNYIGIAALKDHLTKEAYDHFLLLFCSVMVCSSHKYFMHLSVARLMLLQYIEMFAEIYGEEYITSNVHNLSHIADEVARFGELDSFSAYPFENTLGKIKNLLRNGNRPLAQVAKRLMEEMKCAVSCSSRNTSVEQKATILSKRNEGENVQKSLLESIVAAGDEDEELAFYYKLQLKGYRVSTDLTNCWLLTHGNEIVRVINIVQCKELIYLCCMLVQKKQNFFDVPIESSYFNIYSACRESLFTNSENRLIPLSDIKCKMVRLVYHDCDIFIPLWHSHTNPNM